jgi:iron complex transport system permease protein
MIASLGLGGVDLPFPLIADVLLSKLGLTDPYWDPNLSDVILKVRLPRLVLSVLVGGGLAVSGACFQTMFRNPLVAPEILGVSAGAAFGAGLAMLARAEWWQIQLSAFVFGLLAVVVSYIVANLAAKGEITALILGGLVVSSLGAGALGVIKALADPENILPNIVFWLLGSFQNASSRDLAIYAPILALSLGILYFYRYSLEVLSAGEAEAATMGVSVRGARLAGALAATLMTAASVSVCGIVGWVGLIVPHLARFVEGSNFSRLAATSFCLGGLFLLAVDDAIRGVPGIDAPLGALTALIGAPIFLIALSKVRQTWA